MAGSPVETMLMGTVWRGKVPEAVEKQVRIQRADGEIIDITPAAADPDKPGKSVVPPAGESRAPEEKTVTDLPGAVAEPTSADQSGAVAG